MAQLGSKCYGDSIDLTGWHMILDRYGPSIDRSLIRKHLMPLVSRSPHAAAHIINSFGLTIDEFREYVTAQSRHTFEVWVYTFAKNEKKRSIEKYLAQCECTDRE
ncbi:hypothetical protein Pelo_1260 [Pelomyxa schiedti]|nr:hypothetical protein Pelo_1260 [Pelomyxa schiedti]